MPRRSANTRLMKPRPQMMPKVIVTRRARPIATRSWRSSCRVIAYASLGRLLDDHGPARDFTSAPVRGSWWSPSTYSSTVRARAQLGRHRVLLHDASARDVALLVRVAVREEAAVVADERRVALAADPDLIDHAPQLLEAQLADEPPPARLRCASRRTAMVVVGRRSSSMVTPEMEKPSRTARAGRNGQLGLPARLDATGAAGVEDGELPRNSGKSRT